MAKGDKKPAVRTNKDGSTTVMPQKRSMLETQPTIIDEICGYLAQGATDVCVCRIMGINPQTFARWKVRGQEGKGDIYDEFYRRYEKAQGFRELSWLEGIDGKWLLQHHPTTKNDYAEVRYQKQEFTLSPMEEEARHKQMQSAIEEGLGTIKLQIDTQEMIAGEITEYEEHEVTPVDVGYKDPQLIELPDDKKTRINKEQNNNDI
jgi:hypothetical protein